MLNRDLEIIAAQSTAVGQAAIATIRISGERCWDQLAPFFSLKTQPKPNFANYCEFRSVRGEVIDDVIAIFFKGPKSFTGQDSIEISCHGGPYIVQRIMAELLSANVRHADAGEFTKRALLNGKLDVTRAEAIRQLVEANSEQEWLAGRSLMSGRLAELVKKLRDQLIHAMAFLEARIDFPDEGDTQNVHLSHVQAAVGAVKESLLKLQATFDDGKIVSAGLKVVLFSEPNAGKSSLFNQLLGRERAIVSDIAGTTRDYLEEKCLLQGRLVRLIDMAGIRDTIDPIEQVGVERAMEISRDADVLLILIPANSSSEQARKIVERAEEFGQIERLYCQTKSDLAHDAGFDASGVPIDVKIDCLSRDGVEPLVKVLVDRVDKAKLNFKAETSLTTARQKACVDEALKLIANFERIQAQVGTDEFQAFELLHASKALEAVVGAVANDDILDKIFSEFCVGK